jgi:hypothetical protein
MRHWPSTLVRNWLRTLLFVGAMLAIVAGLVLLLPVRD